MPNDILLKMLHELCRNKEDLYRHFAKYPPDDQCSDYYLGSADACLELAIFIDYLREKGEKNV